MLKKLLATSALIALGATSLQSAIAADAGDRSDLRQLVIEPAGTKAPAATAADADKGDIKQFILKQGNGIPTPPTQTAEATADAGAIKDKPENKLIATPPGGIATPGAPAGAPAADAGAPAAGAGAPAADAGAPAAAPADAGAPAAPVAPAAPTAPAIAAPADAGAPAAVDAGKGAAPAIAAPAAPAAAPATAEIKNPKDLFNVLTEKGFGVEIVKKEDNGNFLYHVTIPGNDKDGYLLTVDGEYGKVLEKKYISAYDYSQTFSYHAPATYAPSYGYGQSYSSYDNCDTSSDYNAGY
jgi:hypothetical protein